MGWTTRNHEKSGSYPSLKLAVEIQSSDQDMRPGSIRAESGFRFQFFDRSIEVYKLSQSTYSFV